MKKLTALLLAALFLLGAGCSRDMNWVISNEPSVEGIVEEVGEDYVILRVEEVYGVKDIIMVGQYVRLARTTRLNDCKFISKKGDRVEAWFGEDAVTVGDYGTEITAVHGYTY